MLKKILSYHALIIDLYLSIHSVIAQAFNPIVKLVVAIGLPSKEGKAKTEPRSLSVQNDSNFFRSFYVL